MKYLGLLHIMWLWNEYIILVIFHGAITYLLLIISTFQNSWLKIGLDIDKSKYTSFEEREHPAALHCNGPLFAKTCAPQLR